MTTPILLLSDAFCAGLAVNFVLKTGPSKHKGSITKALPNSAVVASTPVQISAADADSIAKQLACGALPVTLSSPDTTLITVCGSLFIKIEDPTLIDALVARTAQALTDQLSAHWESVRDAVKAAPKHRIPAFTFVNAFDDITASASLAFNFVEITPPSEDESTFVRIPGLLRQVTALTCGNDVDCLFTGVFCFTPAVLTCDCCLASVPECKPCGQSSSSKTSKSKRAREEDDDEDDDVAAVSCSSDFVEIEILVSLKIYEYVFVGGLDNFYIGG